MPAGRQRNSQHPRTLSCTAAALTPAIPSTTTFAKSASAMDASPRSFTSGGGHESTSFHAPRVRAHSCDWYGTGASCPARLVTLGARKPLASGTYVHQFGLHAGGRSRGIDCRLGNVYCGQLNVTVAGMLSSANGTTKCGRTQTQVSGSAGGTGLWSTTSARDNAYWTATFGWSSAPWSLCGTFGEGPSLAPDSGVTFVDRCSP